MVEPADQIWRQRIFTGMAARTVPAVVTDRHRLGEGDVEAERLSDRSGDLGYFERVGHPGALMIFREDEHLCLAGEPAK